MATTYTSIISHMHAYMYIKKRRKITYMTSYTHICYIIHHTDTHTWGISYIHMGYIMYDIAYLYV